MDMALSLKITGGTVVDGSASPGFRTDVGIRGEHIVAIGDLGGVSAAREIRAQDLIVAPGFIDVHTHDDRALLTPGLMVPKVSQGVTTVITGNCGISLAPGKMDRITSPLDLIAEPGWLRFASLGDYLGELESQGIAVNAMCLVGHTTLRLSAMSDTNRPANDAERAQMRAQLEDSLAAGAYGLSTGTFYPPAKSADVDEIIAVGEPLCRYGGIYTTHMRNEAEHILDALDETFLIGRSLGVRVLISHHKIAGVANHGRSVETLKRIAAAMQHQPVSLDCYPYNASSTVLRPEFVARASSVLVTWSKAHPEHAGKTLAQIAEDFGCAAEEAATRLMPAGAIYFMMDEADVRRILSFPSTMIGSDGMPHDEHPHPRGTFPRVLGHYARDEGLFSLETAVHKMTGLPARDLGLHDRGLIREGYVADITLFDAATVIDKATFENAAQASDGIQYVVINGRLAFEEGALADATAGKVIRPS